MWAAVLYCREVRSTRSSLKNYALVFLVWTVLGLFFFTQGLVQKAALGDPTPWWHYLISWMTSVYLCAFMTPAVFWLGKRFPFSRRNWVRPAGLHILLSVIFALIEITIHSLILASLGLFPALMKTLAIAFAFLMAIAFHQNVTTYWTLLGVQWAFDSYRKYQERERAASRLEAQLARAQLGALKMQLQPHFLFNTLNAIMVLVRQQKGREAEEMLVRLSDLLRCVLEDVEEQEVTLRRELEYVRIYLSIEQVRFPDRLVVEIDAMAETQDAAVPQMGLQPLVENAIRHGIGRSLSAGKIQIRAIVADGALRIEVRDDGPGLTEGKESQTGGIGLANTRARLQQLYGDAGRLRIENAEPRGAVVTMTLPYRKVPVAGEMEWMEMHAADHVDRR